MSTAKRGPAHRSLEAHVGFWLRRVSNHVSHAFGRRLQRLGVTTAEWVILRQACDSGITSVSRLSDETGLTRGAVSKLVERLAAKELLRKADVKGDRRRQEVRLTPAGRALVPRLTQAADENDRFFFAHLSAARRRGLVALMRELVERHRLRGVPLD